MPRTRIHVALLRGINVGKSGRIKMADLTRELALDGVQVVATVVQSGNLVIADWKSDSAQLARTIEATLSRRASITTRCLVRSSDELDRILSANPLSEVASDPSRYLVHLCEPALTSRQWKVVVGEINAPEHVAFAAGSVYQWCPDGVSNAQLVSPLLERSSAVAVTARNWRTLESLAAACP